MYDSANPSSPLRNKSLKKELFLIKILELKFPSLALKIFS